MKNNKKVFIPKPPKVEEPLTIKREDIKNRKTWKVNPVEKVIPNKKKNFSEQSYSNKGNLRNQIERELQDDEEA